MPTPISIIIPAFNQLEYCRQCIHSIQRNTRREHRLILVDNGSTDGVADYFDSVAEATVIHSDSNRGFAGGVNLGLEHAEGHLVLLNSDTLVPEEWLTRLEAALLSADDIGMVGPMSNNVSGSQMIENLQFSSLDEISAHAADLAQRKAGRLRETQRLVAFCVLIRDAAFQKVGRFDDRFGLGNFEDDDYGLRILQAGYRLCIAEDCFVFHYGSRTFAGMGLTGERWTALMAENEQKFLAKWGGGDARESEGLNRQAREAFLRGDTLTALSLLKQAIAAAPVLAVNYNDLGAILWQLGDPDRAYEHFLRAVRLDPASAEARDNLRDAARALGKECET